ncbi:MAG: preprotein translocase subunit SecE [Parachlamydiales bacterium]
MRKAQSTGASQVKRVGALQWMGGIKAEFKKITWTTREELKSYTKIVIGATFAVGLGIYLVDLGIQGILSGLSALVKAIVS